MELYRQLMPAVVEGAEAAGRTIDDVDRMIEIKMSYDHDADTALENTRFWAPLSLTPEQKHSVGSAVEMERLADELPIEQVAKRWIVASDPDEAIAQIKPYIDAGLNHLVFHGLSPRQPDLRWGSVGDLLEPAEHERYDENRGWSVGDLCSYPLSHSWPCGVTRTRCRSPSGPTAGPM